MKKLPIICLIVMMFTVVTAHSQPYPYEVAPCGTKDFTTAEGLPPGGIICLDIYLTAAWGAHAAGGVWIDASGSLSDISIVSAGRCMNDGSEGCVWDWTSGAGANVPGAGGPGTHMLVVASLGGTPPDGDGDLIIGTMQLQNLGPGADDATVNFTTIPSVATWTPINDSDVIPGQIVISEVCDCTTDADCDDGNFCNGVETCDGACGCDVGSNPCPTDTTCNEDTDTCDPIPATGIPTLSEWGMIIFMTIILGIGVVTLVRRRMV